MVDDQAVAAQLPGDVPVAAAIAAIGQHQPLDGIAHRGIVLARRAGLPQAVIAGAADAAAGTGARS